MKRILILSFWNPTIQNPNKGIFIHDQIRAICHIRSDIIVLAVNILPSCRTLFKEVIITEELNSNTLITFNVYSILWKVIYVNPWFLYILIKKYLQKKYPLFHPKLIHSNVIFPCAIVGHFLANKYSAEHVISEHWSRAGKLLTHPVFKAIALKTYQNSSSLLCVSNFLAAKIKLVTGNQKVTIIPNIIDTTIFKYKEKHNKTKQNFTCIATWKKPKRLDLIIHSLATYAKETSQKITLHVVGEGIQKDEFSKSFSHDFLSIQWMGHISKPEIAVILGETDIFLHASEIETFSIVTAEALSTGTPVLASNTGALPELINHTNGVLVENNIEAWVKGIYQITQKTYNHEAIAQEVSNKYSPKSVAQSIEKVYEDIMNIQT